MSKLVFLKMFVAGLLFAILNLATCQFQWRYADRFIEMSDAEMNTSLKIRCSPRSSIQRFTSSFIYRLIPNSDMLERMAVILYPPDTLILTVFVSRSIDVAVTYNLSIGMLLVDLKFATCEDSGTYMCIHNTTQPAAKGSFKHVTYTNVHIDVLPGDIQMTAVPNDVPLKVGSTLKLICKGRIGSNGSEVKWVWEFRNSSTLGWTEYLNQADIATSKAEEVPFRQCRLQQESILTRKVDQDDFNREYRCYIRRRSMVGIWKNYAKMGAIYPQVKSNTTIVRDEDEVILENGEEQRTIREPVGGLLMAVLIGLNIAAFLGYLYYSTQTKQEKQHEEDKQSEEDKKSED